MAIYRIVRRNRGLYKQTYGFVYVLNIVFQSIFNLLFQVGLGVLAGWLLTTYANSPDWVYVPSILLGVGTGILSMMKFILSAMKSLEAIEKQDAADDITENGENNE